MESISVRIETEVQERIYYDRSEMLWLKENYEEGGRNWISPKTFSPPSNSPWSVQCLTDNFRRINTVVDHDREANGQALVNLKEHMERENEILRFAVCCLYILSFLSPTGLLALFQLWYMINTYLISFWRNQLKEGAWFRFFQMMHIAHIFLHFSDSFSVFGKLYN